MTNKEKNFVSAVVHLGQDSPSATPFLEMLTDCLSTRFEHYELIFVNDAAPAVVVDEVRGFLRTMPEMPSVTMINMSLRQGQELAMNAGQDMAIGDFVYEFDTLNTTYPKELIDQAYDTCLAGNDIVSVSPLHNRSLSSSVFYRMFNSSSHSKYQLQTDVFRLLSRRAINRVRSISDVAPYRKAAYAASGLKLANLTFKGTAGKISDGLRMSKAMDSLALYTTLAGRFSVGIAAIMLVLMVAAAVYTIYHAVQGGVMEGWVTTMLMMSGGFFGVFLILSIVLKYLSLLVDLVFKKQKYLVESVEKIS